MSEPTSRETRFSSKNNKQPISPAITNKNEKFQREFELRLSKQIEDLNMELKSFIQQTHNNLVEKLDKIVADFNSRLDDVNKSMSALTVRIEILEQTSESNRCYQLENQVSALQNKIDAIEREKLSTDVILHGVPKTTNEDLRNMFVTLCSSINCVPAPVPKEIFRTKSRENAENSAIIIKFPSVADKITVLKSANQAFRAKRKPLCLHNLGLQSDRRIHLNESLTAHNQNIFRKAFHLKRHDVLSSVFTRSGQVYVRQTPKGRAFLIDCYQRLESLANVTNRDENVRPDM